MQERSYSSRYDPRTRSIAVVGAIDEQEVPTFRADLAAAGTPGGGGGLAVIDLSQVDYFPSVAVAALVAALKAEADDGRPMPEVRATDGCVAQRVLEMCAIPHRRT